VIITLRQQRMRWAKRVLFILSAVLLGYVSVAFVQAKICRSKADDYLARQILQHSPYAEGEAAHEPAEGDILGRIEIPRLKLSAVILEGTQTRTLRLGAGHIGGTAFPGKPGNSAIAGHRDIFFRSLKGIHADDEIQLQTQGGSTRYFVVWVKVVAPEDVSILDPTDESELTLVTCYPFYFIGTAPKRFVVRAHQVAAAVLERAQVESAAQKAVPAILVSRGTQ